MGKHLQLHPLWKNHQRRHGLSRLFLVEQSCQMRSLFRPSVSVGSFRGSISKVMADDHVGISASYDATIILWDLAKKGVSDKLIGPHKEAIMDFEWINSLLVTGDKSGVVAIWVFSELFRTSTSPRWLKLYARIRDQSPASNYIKNKAFSLLPVSMYFTFYRGWVSCLFRHEN